MRRGGWKEKGRDGVGKGRKEKEMERGEKREGILRLGCVETFNSGISVESKGGFPLQYRRRKFDQRLVKYLN